jgi:hypothetical protein
VKGINLVSALYRRHSIQIPLAYQLVVKTLRSELTSSKTVWKSDTTTNEMVRDLVKTVSLNQVLFEYVACESCGSPPGYTNADNINLVLALNKHLIGAVKSNLEVALSKEDKRTGKFVDFSTQTSTRHLSGLFTLGRPAALAQQGHLGKRRWFASCLVCSFN